MIQLETIQIFYFGNLIEHNFIQRTTYQAALNKNHCITQQIIISTYLQHILASVYWFE